MTCNRFRASPHSAPEDALAILARAGFNTVRLRVWVQPLANHSDGSVANVLGLCKRAKAAGLAVWLDFHLSDWWADPGHQAKPASWAALPFPALVSAVGGHVQQVLGAVAALGVRIALVQVGNEISPGMLFPEAGQACGDSGRVSPPCQGTWPQLGALLAAGIAAVRSAAPGALVAIHTDLGNRGARAASDAIAWYTQLNQALLPSATAYDVIALSYYMQYSALGPAGQAPLAAALAQAFPAHPLLLAETSYPWAGTKAPGPAYAPTQQGQLAFWRDTVGNASSAGMLGVAWWGGEYAGAWTALFDAQYTALPALLQGWL